MAGRCSTGGSGICKTLSEHQYGKDLHWTFIRHTLATVADTAIIPMQDYLGLGSKARINTPSVLGGNWQWRMKKEQLSDKLADRIYEITELYERL